MNFITVYEMPNVVFPYYTLIPIFLLFIFGYLAYKSIRLKFNLIICVILSITTIFMFAICFANIYGFCDMRNNLIKPYLAGNYLTVEGTVENFKPLPLYGNGTETFEINGVIFNYSDTSLQYVGYNTISAKGGFINKEGQKVRIQYIHDDTYDTNVILKLDIEIKDYNIEASK